MGTSNCKKTLISSTVSFLLIVNIFLIPEQQRGARSGLQLFDAGETEGKNCR